MGSVWRWCRRGVKSRCGNRIKLRHVRVGGKIFTTEAWLDEFFKATAESDAAHFDVEHEPQPKPPSDAQRARQIDAARTRLKAAGVL